MKKGEVTSKIYRKKKKKGILQNDVQKHWKTPGLILIAKLYGSTKTFNYIKSYSKKNWELFYNMDSAFVGHDDCSNSAALVLVSI